MPDRAKRLAPLAVLLVAAGCGAAEPVPPAWRGSYAFEARGALSAQDRGMLGTAFRLEGDRLAFERGPEQPLFEGMPAEWRVVGWERGDFGLCQVELRAGDDGIGLDFVGEPSGAEETLEVAFTYTLEDATGRYSKVRGGTFRHVPVE